MALPAIQPAMLAKACSVPDEQLGDLMELKASERDLVRERLAALREILSAPKRSAAIAKIAHEKRLAGRKRGWSRETLDRLARRFVESGCDWRALRRDYRGREPATPPELVAHFSERVLLSPTGTSAKAAYRELVNDFSRGVSIPGIGTKYEWAERTGRPAPGVYATPRELPDGMSYRTLLRKLPKNKYARALIRGGVAAAQGDAPAMVLRTRKNLRFLEWIAFDDVRLDNRCVFEDDAGKKQIGYPLAVFALDVATGCDVAHVCIPRVSRDKDGTTYGIASEDVRILLVNIIREYGLPEYPINLCIENSAATLSDADELSIKQTFGDHIIIHRCGTLRDTFLKNGFYESGGKPWSKGWVEVFFRGLQEHLSLIFGATGRRYDNIPAQLKAVEAYLVKMFGHCADNAEIAAKLVIELPRFEDICDAVIRILDNLQRRIDHKLEGFRMLQFWRRDKFDSLHSMQSLALLPDGEADAVEIIERPESPFERKQFLKASCALTPIPARCYAHLYALKEKAVFRIRSGGLVFDSKRLKRHRCEKILENLVFEAPPYEIIEKYTGVEVLCYFEDDLSAVHLTREGAYICCLKRKRRVNPLDAAAVEEEIVSARKRILEDRAKVAELTPRLDERFGFMKEHNRELLKNAGLLGDKMREKAVEKKAEAAAETKCASREKSRRRAAIAAAARAASAEE